MNKLLLSAAITALISGSAFAHDVTRVDVGPVAAGLMGGAAAAGGSQAASDSFNTLLSNNVSKFLSDNAYSSTTTLSFERKDIVKADNGSVAAGDDIDDSVINTGSGIAADGDVTVLEANTAASSNNAQTNTGANSAQSQTALAAPSSLAVSANKGGEVEFYDIAGNSGAIALKGGTNTSIPVNVDVSLRDVNTAIDSNQQVGSDQALDDSTTIDASETIRALDSVVASKGGRVDQSTDNSIEVERGGQIGDSVDVSRGGQIGDDNDSYEANLASKNDVETNIASKNEIDTDVSVEDNVLQNASQGGENEIED